MKLNVAELILFVGLIFNFNFKMFSKNQKNRSKMTFDFEEPTLKNCLKKTRQMLWGRRALSKNLI